MSLGTEVNFVTRPPNSYDSKTNHDYLKQYPEIPWNAIMGLRDIIAHEYHHIDAEEIVKIIEDDLPKLQETIFRMKNDIL